MKKITVFFVMALISLSCFAQFEKAGRFGTEIYFQPWNTNSNFSLIDGVKARFFITDNFAIRTTLNFSTTPQTSYSYTTNLTNREVETKDFNNFTTFGINPGVEYHFGIYDRLSIYAGGELRFAASGARYEQTNDDTSEKIEWTGRNNNGQRGGVTLGIAAFTGIDYYILSRLYIGAELGLRFTTTRNAEVTEKYTPPAGQTTEINNKNYDRNSRFGFYCLPAIRIGWNF